MSPQHGAATLRARPAAPVGALALFAAALLAPAGGDDAVPAPGRRTVVVVPGVTGVDVVDTTSGEVLWGRGGNLLGPADGGYSLAVPIVPATAATTRPGGVIRRIRIGPLTRPVYAPLVHRLERHGWSLGDLSRPEAGGDLFLFAYDWRRDNSEAAVRLATQLERLAAASTGRLALALVCQSNGAHICRYLLKYGGASLEEAERGVRRPPAGVDVEQLVLVGTANGGSLRTLHQLNSARRYVPTVGRRFQPEIFFTFESLYQDLPTYRDDLFIDAAGRELAVDLWDAVSWERYGWSIFDRAVRDRIAGHADLFGDLAAQRDFLRRALDRGLRLQRLLRRDGDIGSTRYFTIQNESLPTPDRALLRPAGAGWETLIAGDPGLAGLPIAAQLATAGDGHAPVASQRWLTPSETAALEAALIVDAGHFGMITEAPTLDYLAEICSRPPGPRPTP